MKQILRTRKILKAHAKNELKQYIAEHEARGWKAISDIKDQYGNYQVLLELTTVYKESLV